MKRRRRKRRKMTSFDINAEIEKELNMLEPEKKDVNKIARATHRSLLTLSIKDAVMEMREEKKENEENKENGEGEGEKEEEEEEEKEIKLWKKFIVFMKKFKNSI